MPRPSATAASVCDGRLRGCEQARPRTADCLEEGGWVLLDHVARVSLLHEGDLLSLPAGDELLLTSLATLSTTAIPLRLDGPRVLAPVPGLPQVAVASAARLLWIDVALGEELQAWPLGLPPDALAVLPLYAFTGSPDGGEISRRLDGELREGVGGAGHPRALALPHAQDRLYVHTGSAIERHAITPNGSLVLQRTVPLAEPGEQLDLSADGRRLATDTGERFALSPDAAADLVPLLPLEPRPAVPAASVVLSPDGEQVAVLEAGTRQVTLYATDTGELLHRAGLPALTLDGSFRPVVAHTLHGEGEELLVEGHVISAERTPSRTAILRLGWPPVP